MHLIDAIELGHNLIHGPTPPYDVPMSTPQEALKAIEEHRPGHTWLTGEEAARVLRKHVAKGGPPIDPECECDELHQIRREIGEQINRLRFRYGNKDGHAWDGSYRRYDNPLWQQVEDALSEANRVIFGAMEKIRAAAKVTP